MIMRMSSAQRVAIIGASGYTGAELLRLCAQHPSFELVYATGDTMAGTPAADLYPSLAAAYPHLVFEEFDPPRTDGLDVVFLGLPHEASMALAPQLVGSVGCVVDLSAAYRLKDASLYPTWYGFEHDQSELLSDAVFGLPELYRSELKGARLVATPGCHVTAAALALAPLTCRGLVEPTGIIVNSITGLSGAGRSLKQGAMFCSVDEDVQAYGLLDHRHTPEIEQVITPPGSPPCQVLFTPHLAPLNRGILATCYARPTGDTDTEQLLAAMSDQYHDEEFVVVGRTSPSTKATLGTNAAHVTARYRRAHEHRHLDLCDRQPLQGREWRRGAGRQRRARARGGCRAPEGRPLPVTATTSDAAAPGTRAGSVPEPGDAALRTATLVEALPYIQRFAGQVVVVKYGGNALAGASDDDALALFAQDVVLMRAVGHAAGHRAMAAVRRSATSCSGWARRRVPQRPPRDGLGDGRHRADGPDRSGQPADRRGDQRPRSCRRSASPARTRAHPCRPRVTSRSASSGTSSRSTRRSSRAHRERVHPRRRDDRHRRKGQAYNINADTVAGAIAEALGAEKLVYLTDIEGLRRSVGDAASLIRQTTPDELSALMADGTIAGGMIPKVESCVQAVRSGVRRAHILDGRIPHVLLLEIFTDDGIGTMVRELDGRDQTGGRLA
jgi:N-acetyl-gamma-glutamyl-phosphate reductase